MTQKSFKTLASEEESDQRNETIESIVSQNAVIWGEISHFLNKRQKRRLRASA